MGDERKAKCASCGAAIIWIKDQNGTSIPLNATRVRVYSDPSANNVGWCYRTYQGEPDLHHISHFVSCPGASQHSKGKQ